ncbi:MAG: hypothetical protein RhofKO_16790 [Rhodothermales bacterium]
MRYWFFSDAALVQRLLEAPDAAEGPWREFLRRYSNLFLKVIWQVETDHDAVMDAYVEVCSRLAADGFAKLRQYNPDRQERAAKLSTWLAVVVRNMSLEQRRTRLGRRRMPKAVLALSEVEQTVFKRYYWDGYTPEDIKHQLGSDTDVQAALDRIDALALRPSKAWASEQAPPLARFDEQQHSHVAEDAEAWAAWFEHAVQQLPAQEQLALRLRFWEGLTAPQIATALGIPPRKVYTLLDRATRTLRTYAEAER